MRHSVFPISAIKDYDSHYVNLGLSNYLVDFVFCHLPAILSVYFSYLQCLSKDKV